MSKLSKLTAVPSNVVESVDDASVVLTSDDAMPAKIEEVRIMVGMDDVDLDDYRSAYADATGEQCELDDEQIIEAIARVNDDDTASIVKMMQAMSVATGDEPEADATRLATQETSLSVAEKLAVDDAFQTDLERVLTAKETWAAGPITLLIHLNRLWSKEDWALVPVPGSTPFGTGKDTDLPKGSNAPHDVTYAKEGKRKIAISWFTETCKAVNPKLFADFADIANVSKRVEERELINAQRKEWASLPVLKKASKYNRLFKRIGAFKDLIQKAVRVQFAINTLANVTYTATLENGSTMERPVIGVDFDWADKKAKVLHDSASPIQVWDNTVSSLTDKTCEPLTVTTFLKLKLDEWQALETDEYTPTFADLMNTLTRDKDDIAARKLAAKFKIDNVNEAFHSFLHFANYVDVRDNLQNMKRHVASLANTPDPNNPVLMSEQEEMIWEAGEAFAKARAFYDFIRPDYERLFVAHKNGTKMTRMDAVDAALKAAQVAREAATG